MAPYHHLMVHFPIALWTVAALVILWRAFSDGALAQAAGRVLTPLLALSVVTGLVAYVIGLMVFPYETITASPLGRNKLIAATWSLAYWTLIAVTVWRLGEAVWAGMRRWTMLGLGALGGILLAVTGALGGHLSGSPSAVSQLFRLLGWEVYTTFYVPGFILVALVLVAGVLAARWVSPAGAARRHGESCSWQDRQKCFRSRGINAVYRDKVRELRCLPDAPPAVGQAVMDKMDEMGLPLVEDPFVILIAEGATVLAFRAAAR